MKFSVIIPVYNSSKFIYKCLKSLKNQTFKDFEVIIINDGSTDDSEDIIKEFLIDKRFSLINKNNGGLSSARNLGVEKAQGEYILFLDSDDFFENDLLQKLSSYASEDIIRFQAKMVDENYNYISNLECNIFEKNNGNDAFLKMYESNTIEPACFYAYKREYFIENNFKYMENTYHEDFGLTILIILKAKSVTSIDYIGYNYYQSNNSIMRNSAYEKTVKKAFDMLKHYDFLNIEINKLDLKSKDIVLAFISNSLILKLNNLKNEDYKMYKDELRKRGVVKNLLVNSFKRKIKKAILKKKIGV